MVPALVLEDGTTIGEVPAIMRYLDEAFPETPMLGATPKDKADFAKALDISIPEGHRALTRWKNAVSARPSAGA